MNGSFYLGKEFIRMYKRGQNFLSLIQVNDSTSTKTIHTIFEPVISLDSYPEIEKSLSDTISLCVKFQKNTNLYRAFLEKETIKDDRLSYQNIAECKAENIYEALELLNQTLSEKKGKGR